MRAKHPSNAAQYVPALTGIRALAALLVLGMHTEQNVPAGLDSLLPFFARGYLGVDFFFVLSGFIITHVYFASLASPSRSAVQSFSGTGSFGFIRFTSRFWPASSPSSPSHTPRALPLTIRRSGSGTNFFGSSRCCMRGA